MELKELLGEELFNQVTSKLGDHQLFLHGKSQKVMIDDGTLIPKYRLDEKNSHITTLESQVKQAEADMKDLKKKAAGNEDFVKEIETLQASQKALKTEAEQAQSNYRKEFAIKESLMNAGVNDPTARNLLALNIKNDIGLEKIELNDKGLVKGFDEIIKPVKENKTLSGMFGEIKHIGNDYKGGDNPNLELGDYANKNPFSRKTLNITEQIKLTREKPDLAKRLREVAV